MLCEPVLNSDQTSVGDQDECSIYRKQTILRKQINSCDLNLEICKYSFSIQVKLHGEVTCI